MVFTEGGPKNENINSSLEGGEGGPEKGIQKVEETLENIQNPDEEAIAGKIIQKYAEENGDIYFSFNDDLEEIFRDNMEEEIQEHMKKVQPILDQRAEEFRQKEGERKTANNLTSVLQEKIQEQIQFGVKTPYLQVGAGYTLGPMVYALGNAGDKTLSWEEVYTLTQTEPPLNIGSYVFFDEQGSLSVQNEPPQQINDIEESGENLSGKELLTYFGQVKSEIEKDLRESCGLEIAPLLREYHDFIEEMGTPDENIPEKNQQNSVIIREKLKRIVGGKLEKLEKKLQEYKKEYQGRIPEKKRWAINDKMGEIFDDMKTDVFPAAQFLIKMQNPSFHPKLPPNPKMIRGSGTSLETYTPQQKDFETYLSNVEKNLSHQFIDQKDGEYELNIELNTLNFKTFDAYALEYDDGSGDSLAGSANISEAQFLNEEDRATQAEAMGYYLLMILPQILPYVGGVVSIPIDAMNVFSSEDATMLALKKAEMVPEEYEMENHGLEHGFALFGLVASPLGLQSIAKAGKAKKIAKAIRAMSKMSRSNIDDMIENIGEKFPALKKAIPAMKSFLKTDEMVEIAKNVKQREKSDKISPKILKATRPVSEAEFRVTSEVDWNAIQKNFDKPINQKVTELETAFRRNLTPEEINALKKAHTKGTVNPETGEFNQTDKIAKLKELRKAGLSKNEAKYATDLGYAGDFENIKKMDSELWSGFKKLFTDMEYANSDEAMRLDPLNNLSDEFLKDHVLELIELRAKTKEPHLKDMLSEIMKRVAKAEKYIPQSEIKLTEAQKKVAQSGRVPKELYGNMHHFIDYAEPYGEVPEKIYRISASQDIQGLKRVGGFLPGSEGSVSCGTSLWSSFYWGAGDVIYEMKPPKNGIKYSSWGKHEIHYPAIDFQNIERVGEVGNDYTWLHHGIHSGREARYIKKWSRIDEKGALVADDFIPQKAEYMSYLGHSGSLEKGSNEGTIIANGVMVGYAKAQDGIMDVYINKTAALHQKIQVTDNDIIQEAERLFDKTGKNAETLVFSNREGIKEVRVHDISPKEIVNKPPQ